LVFECDGTVSQPLSEESAEKALDEYFSVNQYITPRLFATLCNCSRNTAYRRIEKLVAEGKMKQSTISKGMYERG
jgi:predicted HTH transcriptional regulator